MSRSLPILSASVMTQMSETESAWKVEGMRKKLATAGMPLLLVPDLPRQRDGSTDRLIAFNLLTLEIMNLHTVQNGVLSVVEQIMSRRTAPDVQMERVKQLLADCSQLNASSFGTSNAEISQHIPSGL
jgi:hypothetical protein